jgi:peptidyl-prolyl cis-trans isomerase SurA
MTPAGLTKALASQGVDAISLKKRLRAQMIWQMLVQRRTVAKAQVSNQAVRDAIAAKGADAATKATEYQLQQIIFVVPKGSSAGFVSQRRSEALAFRQRFAGCDQSMNQAKALRDVVVKDMGRHLATDFNGPIGDALQKAKAGDTLSPQQTDNGIEMIAVCGTHDIDSNAQARNEAQTSLYIKQAADLGKDYLQELRSQAIIERR